MARSFLSNLESFQTVLVVKDRKCPCVSPAGLAESYSLPSAKRRLWKEIHMANNDDKAYCDRRNDQGKGQEQIRSTSLQSSPDLNPPTTTMELNQ